MHNVCVGVCLLLCPFAVLTSINYDPESETTRVDVLELSSVILDCPCESSEKNKWEYSSSFLVFLGTSLVDDESWTGFTLVRNYSLRIGSVKYNFEGSYVCWCKNSSKARYHLKIVETELTIVTECDQNMNITEN
ncbi:hypothetical protein HOLleu_04115 [Holothuria leucospilota]|uniref:Ig-like domain-containing protein n=1 Tax=Holothuria leucospilota TaxID=206669 RepID=A0A9Q1CU56_HOLLE|nr:hypothetical protein HOLleu_04115 [Holothuria leucospilota]